MGQKKTSSRKIKTWVSLLVVVIFISFVFYKLFLYEPPLIDPQRNLIDKITDFFYFSWHFTKASVYKDFLKNRDKSRRELEKAGWYDKKYLGNRFKINQDDTLLVLKVYGENLITWKKWKTAVKAFSRATQLDSTDYVSYYYLGLCYWKQKKYTIKELFEKDRRKLGEVVDYLGQGIASLISVFDPEIVVLAGGVRENGDKFLNMLKKSTKKHSFLQKNTKIIWTRLSRPGILGASLI